MEFTLDMVWRTNIKVEADSRIEAIAKAKEQLPNHKPVYISDDEGNSTPIKICDFCDKYIFDWDDENDAIYADDNGNRYCKSCSVN